MRARRKRAQLGEISYFREIQRDLPDTLKMRIMSCEHRGEPIAGLAVPPVGGTALKSTRGNRRPRSRPSGLVPAALANARMAEGPRFSLVRSLHD